MEFDLSGIGDEYRIDSKGELKLRQVFLKECFSCLTSEECGLLFSMMALANIYHIVKLDDIFNHLPEPKEDIIRVLRQLNEKRFIKIK